VLRFWFEVEKSTFFILLIFVTVLCVLLVCFIRNVGISMVYVDFMGILSVLFNVREKKYSERIDCIK
jgi:hypothetical protein